MLYHDNNSQQERWGISMKEDYKGLLREPREELAIEIKDWLDLSDNAQRASLAKAVSPWRITAVD
jgi:hypothetical protein